MAGGARTLDAGTNINVEATLAEANARRPVGVMSRMRRALAYVIAGADSPLAFFGPLQPMAPSAQQPEQGAVGRAFDYQTGYNQRITPRQDEAIGFGTMKALADGYDLLRLVIETRKDQVAAIEWNFGPKDETRSKDADVRKRCDVLQAFFDSPDKQSSLADWLRMLLEQLFVYDAPAIYVEMTRGGDPYRLQVLDGATITRKLTLDGRTPLPSEGPAYQQVLKGLPAVDYVALAERGVNVLRQDNGLPLPELLYKPRNPRVDRVYGYSPVEQLIATVNIALRRQFHQLTYYTDGATPDLLMQVPESWNADQIAKMQKMWDDMLSGNSPNRRHGYFIPAGVVPYNTKEAALKDEYDEWLARITCFGFSISPTPFIKQVNRATADNATEQAKEEGLKPILQWVIGFVNVIVARKFGWPDLTLRYEEEEALTAAQQETIYSGYIKSRVYHPDEIRQKLGDDPMPEDMRAQMDLANFVDAANATVLPDDQQQAQNEHAIALAAARPPPTAPQPAAKAEEIAALLKAAPAPSIHVDARTTVEKGAINATTTVEPAQITVEPHIDARTTIAEGAIKQGDQFLDVGGTNVKIDAPKVVKRDVSYGRDADGTLVGKITETHTRTVHAERTDGGVVAKFEE